MLIWREIFSFFARDRVPGSMQVFRVVSQVVDFAEVTRLAAVRLEARCRIWGSRGGLGTGVVPGGGLSCQ